MALMAKCSFAKTLLELQNPEQGMYTTNHIFEPEFHQDIYVKACESTKIIPGAFQVGCADLLERSISRGTNQSMWTMKLIQKRYCMRVWFYVMENVYTARPKN